jgi:hypothetical protein
VDVNGGARRRRHSGVFRSSPLATDGVVMVKKPFFSRFLETEKPADLAVVTPGVAGAADKTNKWPSDKDEQYITKKYPSDDDESYTF